MTPERKLEIAVLKAYWEELFEERMDAAEIHVESKDRAARMKAQCDLIHYGIELARTEVKIRELEKAQ